LIDNFVVIVRCNAKTTVIGDEEYRKLKNQDHNFSMIVTIEELNKDSTISGNLYDGIINENTIESIINLDTDLDLTLG